MRHRPLGSGVTVAEWIKHAPDRFVTRRDMALLFAMYEHAQRRSRARHRWWRRLWRWLLQPFRPLEPPEPPSPPSS